MEQVDLDTYPSDVREVLDEVNAVYGQFSATKLRAMTHEEPPWRDTPQSETISYEKLKDFFKILVIVDDVPQAAAVTNPFAIHHGKENGELDKTIENAKRDGVRVHRREFGSQQAGQIETSNTRDVFRLPEGQFFKGKRETVPVRYELLLDSHQSCEEQYATLVHELGHLYCGHLGRPNQKRWPDRRDGSASSGV